MEHSQPIRIILADDHQLVREGLALLLATMPDIKLIAQASNGGELVRLAAVHHPDVVITDLQMPVKSGLEALREIRALGAGIKCLAVSMFENEYRIVEALEAGAIGYINKNAEKEELADAIRSIYEGHPYYCKTTSVRVIQLLARSSFNPYANAEQQYFSPLEEKIIILICKELSSKEIGEKLFMGKRNIDLHRARILEKMNVKTPAGVALYAIRNNIISIDELDTHAV